MAACSVAARQHRRPAVPDTQRARMKPRPLALGGAYFLGCDDEIPGDCCLSCARTRSYVPGRRDAVSQSIRESEGLDLALGIDGSVVKDTTQPTADLRCSLPGNDRPFQSTYQTRILRTLTCGLFKTLCAEVY